jgi:hypothetical protein
MESFDFIDKSLLSTTANKDLEGNINKHFLCIKGSPV